MHKAGTKGPMQSFSKEILKIFVKHGAPEEILYLNNPEKYTIALGLRLFMDSTGESSWGALFAMSFVSLIPVLFIFIFLQKYLVEGITAGSVKG